MALDKHSVIQWHQARQKRLMVYRDPAEERTGATLSSEDREELAREEERWQRDAIVRRTFVGIVAVVLCAASVAAYTASFGLAAEARAATAARLSAVAEAL